jgi:hypothetical protein
VPRVSPVQARSERPAASPDVDAARPRRSARLRTTEPSVERIRSAQRSKGNSAATLALVVMSLCFAAVTWWVLRGPAEVTPSTVAEPVHAPVLDHPRVVAPRSPLVAPHPDAPAAAPLNRPSRAAEAPGSPARAKVAAPASAAPNAPNTKPEVYE